MNNMGYNNFTPFISTVNGFVMATPEMLQGIKDYFGLKSDINALKRVQAYFGITEKRDPYVDELRLIDNILASEERSANDFILTDLSANDKRIGDTFNDLIKKLETVSNDTYPYYTPDGILNTGGLCLAALGKNSPAGIKLFSGQNALESAASNESGPFFSVDSNSGKKFIVAVNSKSAPKKDIYDTDSIVFLKAPLETEQTVFCRNVSALLTSTYKELGAKAFNIIGKGGLIESIISLTKGAFLNLSPLYQIFYNISPELLTGALPGSAIAVIPASSIRRFTEFANANGLYAYQIGRPAKMGRINITSSYSTPYSLTYDFLRSLKMKSGISVKINEHPSDVSVSETFNVEGITAKYAYCNNGLAVINAETNVNSYDSAALTLLTAVCRVTSLGISRNDMLASFDVGFDPNDEESAGNGFAAILGIYRAQSELSVSSSASKVTISDTPYCSVTISAKCNREAQNQFKKKGSRVYLLAPRYSEEKLPDFRDERLLLDYVNELWENGEIISAIAVDEHGAESALSKMNNDASELKMANITEISGIGSFIVESDNEISGLFLGFTE